MKTLILDEEILIKNCKLGDPSALEMLYYKFSSILFTLICRYLPVKADAEDILQETFIKIFTNIGTYQNLGSFEGWLKRIAINLCLNHIKQQKKFQSDFDSIENLKIDIIASNMKSSASLEHEELLSILNLLPLQKRTIFTLHEVEGFSNKEIAQMLGITENGVSSQLSKARLMLSALHTKINNYECQ